MADKLTDALFAATSDPKAKGAKLVEAPGILSDLQAGRVANKTALQLRELRISQRRQGVILIVLIGLLIWLSLDVQ